MWVRNEVGVAPEGGEEVSLDEFTRAFRGAFSRGGSGFVQRRTGHHPTNVPVDIKPLSKVVQ